MNRLSSFEAVSEEFDPVSVMESFFSEIRSRATEIEQARRMPQDLADKISATGLFKLAQPSSFGGYQCSPRTLFDTLVEASRADASVGWVLMIGTTGGMMMAWMDQDSLKERLAKNPNAILCGSAVPAGKAIPVEGGYRVSGKWPFGSGSQISDYLFGACLIEGKENELPLLASFPTEEFTIHDTWHVSGLCGTGSHHIELKDAFVEERDCLWGGGKPLIDTAAYRMSQFSWGALGVAAVSGGIALHAIECFKELAAKKTPRGKSSNLASQVSAQKDYAQAVAKVESSLTYARDVLDTVWEELQQCEWLSPEGHARVRLACNNLTWMATEAVDALYHLAGGSAIYLSNNLQKCLRDVHVTTQHVSTNQAAYESVGQVLLGVDPEKVWL